MTSVAINMLGTAGLETTAIGADQVVWSFGDYPAECTALRNDAGLIDVSYGGPVHVSGPDALDLLQACLTRDIEFLIPDRAQSSMVLRPDGTIIDMVTVIAGEDEYTVLTGPGRADEIAAALSSSALAGLDATVSDLSAQTAVFSVEGARSWKVVADVLGEEFVSLGYENVLAVEIDGHDALLARIGVTGEYGYTFILDGAAAGALWTQFTGAGAVPVGHQARETAMLEVRQPIVHREVTPTDSVVSAGLNWLVDLGKEEFIGRDAVLAAADAPSPGGPVGFVVSSGTVSAGDPLHVGVESVGEVVYVTESPSLGASIGLARVTREWQAAGLEFATAGAAVRTLAPPYFVPVSWSTAIDV